MKKIMRKIAMILVLVMLASSFTGCFTMWAIQEAKNDPLMFLATVFPIPLAPILDLITSPIQLTVFIVREAVKAEKNRRGKMMEGIDTFSAAVSSLPKAELNSLMQRYDSLPEEKLVPFTETVNSFSEAENSAMVKAFNNLSEMEILSSMETLNSMSEEELIATLNNFQYINFRYQD